MNRTITAIAFTATAFVGNAWADDITVEQASFVSTMTRSETLAEFVAARGRVAAMHGEAGPSPLTAPAGN